MKKECKQEKQKFYYFCDGVKGSFKLLFSGYLYAYTFDKAYTSVVSKLIDRDNFDLDELSIEIHTGKKELNEI